MISAYSFVISFLFFNIALIIVYVLMRKSDFIAKYGISVLITITGLGFARLVLPFDLGAAHIIRSYHFIPAVQTALNQGVAGTDFTLGEALLALWVLGSAVFLIKDALTILRFKVRNAKYEKSGSSAAFEAAAELGIGNKITVTPDAPVPYVAGYFKPKIFTPNLELDKDEWKFVLMHERQHIKGHDQLIKLLFVVVRAVFWWNPFSHLFMRELDAILELRCDYAVMKNLSEEESLSYFTVILRVVKQLQPVSRRRLGANTALIDIRSRGRDDIKQRFEVYRNSDSRRGKQVRDAIQVLICLMFLASYFVLVQPAYEPPEEDLVDVDQAIHDEIFILNGTNGKYWLYSGAEMIMEIPAEEMDDFPYNTFKVYGEG